MAWDKIDKDDPNTWPQDPTHRTANDSGGEWFVEEPGVYRGYIEDDPEAYHGQDWCYLPIDQRAGLPPGWRKIRMAYAVGIEGEVVSWIELDEGEAVPASWVESACSGSFGHNAVVTVVESVVQVPVIFEPVEVQGTVVQN